LNEDQIELRVDKSKKHQEKAMLNFNFEFTYDDIDSFIGKLDEVDGVYKIFKEILKKLKTEINK